LQKASIALIMFSLILSADVVDSLKKVSLANVNALIILTTQDMLTTGRYDLENASLRVINFPLYYHFEPLFSHFNLFVNGSAGLSELKGTSIVNNTRVNDTYSYDTLALRLGGGVRYVSNSDINILVGFNAIYSRIDNTYNYNSKVSEDKYKPLFDRAFANQESNAYTYESFWQVGYMPNWHNWKPYVVLTVTYFDTKQNLSIEELTTFNSTSGGSRTKIGFETPQFFHFLETDLSTEFFVAGNAFVGDVRDTLGFDGYGSAAAMMHLYIKREFYGAVDEALYEVPSILNRIDFLVERVSGVGIEGYNVGFSAGFTF